MSTDTQQGLEKAPARTPAVITTPEEYGGAMRRWQEQHFNILTPFSNFSALAPSHGLISSLVQVSTDDAAQEIYKGLPFLKQGEVAIAKRGLRKIAEGLGVSTRLEYVSVGRTPHYWHVKAIASYRGTDGAIVEREASQEWDLRDGSSRMKGWTANQISEARKHGLRQCESRAINAAIRECGCGIKQAYTAEELKRPFVAVRVMFTPDMSNPDERRIVLERALGSTNALYGGAHQALPAPPADAFDDEAPSTGGPRHIGSGSTVQPSSTTASGAPPSADEPPAEYAVRIVDIKSKSGDKNGRPWTRYTIVDSQGVEHSTFDKKIADFAEKAKASKEWVEIAEEQDGQYKNLVEILPFGQNPALPGMDNL